MKRESKGDAPVFRRPIGSSSLGLDRLARDMREKEAEKRTSKRQRVDTTMSFELDDDDTETRKMAEASAHASTEEGDRAGAGDVS